MKDGGLNVNNILGIEVDEANLMVGRTNSVTTRLNKIVPHMVIVKCVSHSLHLAAENAITIIYHLKSIL